MNLWAVAAAHSLFERWSINVGFWASSCRFQNLALALLVGPVQPDLLDQLRAVPLLPLKPYYIEVWIETTSEVLLFVTMFHDVQDLTLCPWKLRGADLSRRMVGMFLPRSQVSWQETV